MSPGISVVLNTQTKKLFNCIPWINTRSYSGHYTLLWKSRYSLRRNQVSSLDNMIVRSTWPAFTPWRYQFTIYSLASQNVSYRAVSHSCIRTLRQHVVFRTDDAGTPVCCAKWANDFTGGVANLIFAHLSRVSCTLSCFKINLPWETFVDNCKLVRRLEQVCQDSSLGHFV
jgi:hypothetical protein